MERLRVSRLGSVIVLTVLLAVGPAQTGRAEVALMGAEDSSVSANPSANPLWQTARPGSRGMTRPVDSVTDASAADACDLASAVPNDTITFGQADVSPSCLLVSAGDLVTWVNPLATPITIQAGDDQFFIEDLGAAVGSLDVPAQGMVTVRVMHAGRIDYAARDRPGLEGSILVLGHEGA
jgi:plastocyanin